MLQGLEFLTHTEKCRKADNHREGADLNPNIGLVGQGIEWLQRGEGRMDKAQYQQAALTVSARTGNRPVPGSD